MQRLFLSLLFLLMLLSIRSLSAEAHDRYDLADGYAVVVGWQNEPPLVGERNAVIFIITQDQQPVSGAESTLDVELQYGPRNFRANLIPSQTPGLYNVDVIPTVRGQLTARLFGELGGSAVDIVLEPEEVFPVSRLQFPESAPDTLALQSDVQALQQQVQQARLIGIAGVVTGAIGILSAFLAQRRRKSTDT